MRGDASTRYISANAYIVGIGQIKQMKEHWQWAEANLPPPKGPRDTVAGERWVAQKLVEPLSAVI